MGQCLGCYTHYPDRLLNRDCLCESCAKRQKAEYSKELRRSRRKSCSLCGSHGLFVNIDAAGYCDYCRPKVDAERKRQRRADQLAQNYQSCQNRTARPTVQRVYDSFRTKYPNALVTGLEPKDNDKAMVIYLEGGDEYKVVFNPLTNDVDVSKVGVPVAKERPIVESNFRTDAPANRKTEKSYGMTIFLAIIALLFNLFLLVESYIGGLAGVISSLVALAGGASKSRTAIIFGSIFLLVTLLFAPFLAWVNIILMIFLLMTL